MPRAYTPAEKRRRARLLWKGGRKALAGASTASIDRQLDRIEQAAADRWQRDADAAHQLVATLRTETARAKAAERAAPRSDRSALTAARKRAEQALARAERAAAKYRQ